MAKKEKKKKRARLEEGVAERPQAEGGVPPGSPPEHAAAQGFPPAGVGQAPLPAGVVGDARQPPGSAPPASPSATYEEGAAPAPPLTPVPLRPPSAEGAQGVAQAPVPPPPPGETGPEMAQAPVPPPPPREAGRETARGAGQAGMPPGGKVEPPPPPADRPAWPQDKGRATDGPGFVPQGMPAPGYVMPPPWFPPYGFPPQPYYGYPMPGQTGQMPVPMGPGVVPVPGAMTGEIPTMMPGPGFVPPLAGMPPGVYPPGAMPPSPMLSPLEETEFGSLAGQETSHWRVDFKWVFGIITAMLVLVTLATAGLYRVTGPGAAKQVLVPLIEDSTRVGDMVREHYQQLKSRARKNAYADIYVPDVGVTLTLKSDVITSLSAEDLTQRVTNEIASLIYRNGYRQSLPMEPARGAGEERAKAICMTVLSKLNKGTHSALLWPVVIFGALAFAFGILFLVFCREWGKALGAGIAIIGGSLPGSLFLRVGQQFLWKSGAPGTFKPAANQSLSTMSSMALAYFDIALAFGALVLLAGVIGAVIVRKSRQRVVPFNELEATGEPREAPVGDSTGTPDDEPFFLD